MNWGSLLFSFEGRINRAKYWLAVLVYVVLSVLLSVVGLAIGADSITFSALNMIIGIGTFISGIAVGVKRLHDRNRTGWWLLLFYVVPGVLVAAATVYGLIAAVSGASGSSIANFGIASFFLLGAFLVMVWAFVELGCLRGTVGPNRFGPDPLEVSLAAPVH